MAQSGKPVRVGVHQVELVASTQVVVLVCRGKAIVTVQYRGLDDHICTCLVQCNRDEFSRWAMSVGPMTEKVADHFLKSGKAAEQGYKACADLSKLEQRYGKQRLEAACGKALVYSTAPALRTIASILKNGLDKPDKAESQLPQSKANSYGITRGAAYFRKGGDRGC